PGQQPGAFVGHVPITDVQGLESPQDSGLDDGPAALVAEGGHVDLQVGQAWQVRRTQEGVQLLQVDRGVPAGVQPQGRQALQGGVVRQGAQRVNAARVVSGVVTAVVVLQDAQPAERRQCEELVDAGEVGVQVQLLQARTILD